MLKIDGSAVSVAYDAQADVLYVGFGGDPPPASYSIGNPAGDPDVEWMVSLTEPEILTGAMILNWRRRWVAHHEIPPLPCPMDWHQVTQGIGVPSSTHLF
ncbi:hypothetical protein [Sulfobacillus thermosulfidooxidans]|uniref:hypothetical protein n=1 Tax=Sulfobacillus thermosulfidooxidans TaxID=28034 RepID=UPI0006B6707C|nr:hypothetical protein [Sulfobacillus thermosulfidooxidans]